jgi:hypothetical protein
MNPKIEIKKLELREMMNLLMKIIMNTHQRRNCSEPSDLETPR